MNYTTFASLVREYAGANSITLSDAKITSLLNGMIEGLSSDIEESNPTYFEKTFDITTVEDQREYVLDSNIFANIKRVEWLKDSSTSTEYKPLTEIDLNTFSVALRDTEIRNFMAGRSPRYGIMGSTLFLFTEEQILDLVPGLKIYANIYPQTILSAWFTDGTIKLEDMSKAQSTGAFGVPRQFQELLARSISIQHKTNLDRPMPLSAREQGYPNDLARKIHQTKKQIAPIVPSLPDDDGSNY